MKNLLIRSFFTLLLIANVAIAGDLPLLQWTIAGKGTRFALLVHHTDAEREVAYDRASSVGRLDKALDEAEKEGWTVVDIKNDWKVIYPFEKK
jgi:hypothetical protein